MAVLPAPCPFDAAMRFVGCHARRRPTLGVAAPSSPAPLGSIQCAFKLKGAFQRLPKVGGTNADGPRDKIVVRTRVVSRGVGYGCVLRFRKEHQIATPCCIAFYLLVGTGAKHAVRSIPDWVV